MTHQPPVPEAATSPYPLHPAPIPEDVKQAAMRRLDEEEPEETSALSPTVLGVGAALGLAAAAAVTGLIYARRGSGSSDTGASSGRKKAKRSGDDKSKRGGPDRKRVAAGEPYEVNYFARKHKISAAKAREIIKQAGPDRAAANALARNQGAGNAEKG